MADVATWRTPKFKADATKCASELNTLGANITPEQIVEFAKDNTTELHKCFEWDDTVAAHKFRIAQARSVVCELVIKPVEREATPYRLFYNIGKQENYQPIKVILQDKNKYERLLDTAKKELISYKRKYKMLEELEPVFDVIEKIAY